MYSGAMDVHAAELAPELLLLVLKSDERAPGPPYPPLGPNETRSFESPQSNLPQPEDLTDKKTEDAQSAPPLPDIELRKLYVTGLQAKADGDLDRAEMVWQQILDRNRSYLNGLVDREMQQLQAQLRPIHVRKYLDAADRARDEGEWGQELASLEALLGLEPQNTVWATRRKYALQNRDNSELYEIVRELVAGGAKAGARDHLESLWNDAPAFGDPARLGAQIGYTYEDFQRVVEKLWRTRGADRVVRLLTRIGEEAALIVASTHLQVMRKEPGRYLSSLRFMSKGHWHPFLNVRWGIPCQRQEIPHPTQFKTKAELAGSTRKNIYCRQVIEHTVEWTIPIRAQDAQLAEVGVTCQVCAALEGSPGCQGIDEANQESCSDQEQEQDTCGRDRNIQDSAEHYYQHDKHESEW
jgi:hypothetical protein